MAVRDHDRGGWIPVLNKHKKQVGDTSDPLVTLFVDNFPAEDMGTRWALWQDNKTRSKWVFVNRCYFANDLPEADGRPCSPESNEVYESNHGNTIVAGLIRGPCVVLPPSKFNEESGRRSGLEPGANDGLQPLYLCKTDQYILVYYTLRSLRVSLSHLLTRLARLQIRYCR